MTVRPSARRTVRRWLLALGIAIAAVLALVAVRQRAIATRWAEAVALADAQVVRLEPHVPRRLRTSALTADDAWAHYALAMAHLDREPSEAEGALIGLRRAGFASTARFPIPWAQGLAGDLPDVALLNRLGELSAARTSTLVEEGQLEAAREQLVDGLQLAVDLMGSGVTVHEMVGSFALEAHLRAATALAGTLDPTSPLAARFASDLADTDAAISPGTESVVLDAVFVVRSIRDIDDQFGGGSLTWSLWRYAFSPKLAIAAHIRDAMAVAHQLDALLASDVAPTPGLTALDRRRHASRNPITRLCGQNIARTIGERLRVLLRLRMLRLALAERQGAPAPTLRNPRGGTFHTEREPGIVRVRASDGESLELRSALGR